MIKKIFYGWWIVLACFFIAFYMAGVVAYGFTAFFKPIAREFGWSYTQISLAASLRGLETGMFAPIFGYLVDRFGPRRLIFWGTLTIGFGLVFVSRTNSLTMFYAAFGILALGRSACSPPVLMTAVAKWFRRNVGKALGIMSSGVGASGILVLLIVWLIDLYQWRTTFVILGLGTWLLAIPLSFLIRDRPEHYGYDLDGERSAEQVETPRSQDAEVGFKEAFRGSTFWHLTLAQTIRRMVLIAVITHIMPYLSSVGMSRSGAAVVATSIPLLSILGRFGFGWLGDIFDKRHMMAWSYSCIGAGVLALSYVQEAWVIFPFLIIFPLSWGSMALNGAIVREYFGIASFGKILGVMGGIGTIGVIIGPSVAGWTYDTLGSYHSIWLIFAATSVIPVALILTIKPRWEQAG
ncbi:MAG: MFS transporter [Deltaproteobacteria bacterium]|nr:MAG: MFS transporter [Deltaproteobacteria bacterium]